MRRVLSSKLVELTRVETERERLRARVAERDQRVRELEASLSRAAANAERMAAAEARIRELEQNVAEQRDKIGRLEAELADALAWTPAPEDDLTRIKGIGPKFAAALKELGIVRFSEVAAWSPDDVKRVADKLRVPPSRIDKAGWIEAARALAAGTG